MAISLVERVYRLHRVHWKRWQNRIMAMCCVCVYGRLLCYTMLCQLIEKRLSASATFIFLFLSSFFIFRCSRMKQDSFICKTGVCLFVFSAIDCYSFVNFFWIHGAHLVIISRLADWSFCLFLGKTANRSCLIVIWRRKEKHLWHFLLVKEPLVWFVFSWI